MFIKEIQLHNFRIYKGLNTISLEPSENKNIIVISGKNGFGKTTFLMSLVWCLYGKQMDKVDELYAKEIRDKGNYTKYISDSLNRKAFEEGETDFFVSVTFSDVKIPDITCNEVTIKRSYNVISSATDKVEVLIDGYANELINDLTKDNQKGEEIFIRDFILPIEIAKFFFFDAEKIVSLAEINSNNQRQQLSKAYSEVLGIQKYEDLKANLEEKQDEYRRRSAKPEERGELNQLRTNIENAELEIEKYEKTIDDLRQDKNQREKEAEEIQRKLIREGDKMSIEELNALRKDQEELQNSQNELADRLKDYLDIIPFALAGEILANISEQLTVERALSEQRFRQNDVNGKIDQIRQDIELERSNVNFVLDVSTRDFYEEQIKKLVKKYFYSDVDNIPENSDIFHEFSKTEFNEFNQLLNSIKHNFKEQFSVLNGKYSSIKNQLDSIKRKIRDAEKSAEDEYISGLRDKKESLDRKINEIGLQIESIILRIGELKNQIKTSRQKQDILRKKIDESSVYTEKENKTKQIINRLQKFIAIFKDTKKKHLAKRC